MSLRSMIIMINFGRTNHLNYAEHKCISKMKQGRFDAALKQAHGTTSRENWQELHGDFGLVDLLRDDFQWKSPGQRERIR